MLVNIKYLIKFQRESCNYYTKIMKSVKFCIKYIPKCAEDNEDTSQLSVVNLPILIMNFIANQMHLPGDFHHQLSSLMLFSNEKTLLTTKSYVDRQTYGETN